MPGEVFAGLRLLASSAVAIAIGWPFVRKASLPLSGALAASWTIGLAAVTVPLAIIGYLGLPLGTSTIIATAVALLACSAGVPPAFWAAERPPRRRHYTTATLAIAIFGLDVWKTFTMPLWSWDHFAIWGAKARLLAATHDLSALKETLHANYPLGVPVAFQVLTVGTVPERFEFRLIHVIFLGCVLLLTRAAVLQITESALAGNVSAAFLALMPLAWDTEIVGIADLPLATYAVTAIALRFRDERTVAIGCAICLGFLPWIKQEGLPLAVLLFAALLAFERRHVATGALIAAVFAITSRYVIVGTGATFFVGPWQKRLIERISEPGSVLQELWPYLISPSTLGLWIVVPIALAIALAHHDRRSIALLTAVTVQLFIYCAVYFASYIPPEEHIRSSFHRISSALAPMAVVGIATAFRPRQKA